jgi:hypothetical protein
MPEDIDSESPSEFMANRPMADATPAQRDQVIDLCANILATFKVDPGTNELAFHVAQFRSALQPHCSTAFINQAVDALRQRSGGPQMLDETVLPGQWADATWSQIQHAAGLSSRTQLLDEYGVPADASPEQWRQALAAKSSAVSDPQFASKLKSILSSPIGHPEVASAEQWVTCLVRRLGWWVVVFVCAAVIAFILSITPGGQIAWGLFAILVACGVGATFFIAAMACMESPGSP